MNAPLFNPGRRMTVGVVLTGVLIGAYIAVSVRSAAWCKFYAGFAVRDYLSTHPVRKLQIGAGGQDMPGWLNSDIAPGRNETHLDAAARFPFPEGSIHFIYAEQVIEHLDYQDGLGMLRECHRVLAPGGKVRIATPDLLKTGWTVSGGQDG
jgi:SAM-dependent methyltransferase